VKFRMVVFLLLSVLTTLVHAQSSSLAVFGDQIEDRGLTRVLYWNGATNSAAGQIDIHFGRPAWRAEYDDPKNFDAMTKGKTWRLGKDFWTVLETDLPLKIAGKDVPAGAYYLGAARSADGASWNLVFIDPATARKGRVDASQIEKATELFKVPLTFATATANQDHLTITLTHAKEKPSEVALKIAWGKFELSTAITAGI